MTIYGVPIRFWLLLCSVPAFFVACLIYVWRASRNDTCWPPREPAMEGGGWLSSSVCGDLEIAELLARGDAEWAQAEADMDAMIAAFEAERDREDREVAQLEALIALPAYRRPVR